LFYACALRTSVSIEYQPVLKTLNVLQNELMNITSDINIDPCFQVTWFNVITYSQYDCTMTWCLNTMHRTLRSYSGFETSQRDEVMTHSGSYSAVCEVITPLTQMLFYGYKCCLIYIRSNYRYTFPRRRRIMYRNTGCINTIWSNTCES